MESAAVVVGPNFGTRPVVAWLWRGRRSVSLQTAENNHYDYLYLPLIDNETFPFGGTPKLSIFGEKSDGGRFEIAGNECCTKLKGVASA